MLLSTHIPAACWAWSLGVVSALSLPELMPIPTPKTIQDKLSQWWAAYGKVRIYENVTIIEFADDYALSEMKAMTSLEQYLIAEINPRLILINADAASMLAAELEKSGYTPKLIDRE